MYRDETKREDDEVLVCGHAGAVRGHDPVTGALLWTNELRGGGLGAVALAVHGGVVFATAEGPRLFCIEAATGRTLWEAELAERGPGAIVVRGDRVCVHKPGVLACFDPRGAELWSRRVPVGDLHAPAVLVAKK